MQLPDFIVRQLAKPTGWLGRFILWRLNSANSDMNAATLKALAIKADDRILEIGFGGGALLEEIVRQKPQSVVGIEISQLAISKAQSRLSHAIADGTLKLGTLDGDTIPYEAGTFSKACCVNVIYFWDDPLAMISEVHRALQPDGQFVVCYEHVGPNERDTPVNWVEDCLRTAGFHRITTIRGVDRANEEFFCTTAGKG